MRIESDTSNKVTVQIKTAMRDKDGKIAYVTFDSLNVLEAKPEEVRDVIFGALKAASAKK